MLARRTIISAVVHEAMVEKPPLAFRHDRHQIALDADRVFEVGKIEADRKTPDVRIDRDTDCVAIERRENDICRLARDTGNGK